MSLHYMLLSQEFLHFYACQLTTNHLAPINLIYKDHLLLHCV
jgi:hypothetical protein